MKLMARPSWWHRWTTGLAVIALSAAALVGTAGSAAADVTDNSTPATARTFSSIPFEDSAGAPVDNPAATDATGLKVATACNAGSDIYGTAWWKYTPATRSTVVVHAAIRIGPTPDQPTGLAVVSADLSTVLKCGVEGSSIADAGAFTVEAGSSLYIVAYYDEPTETSILSPTIGVYPSSGVVPANDNYEAATAITSLPFSATQDTTLATLRASDPVCYDRDGAAANVWYSVTVPTSQRLEVTVDTDYSSHLVVATSTEDQSTWQCDTPQFDAQAGVTYLIGVAGTNSLRNSGQLKITVSAAPAAPAVSVRIAPTGKVNQAHRRRSSERVDHVLGQRHQRPGLRNDQAGLPAGSSTPSPSPGPSVTCSGALGSMDSRHRTDHLQVDDWSGHDHGFGQRLQHHRLHPGRCGAQDHARGSLVTPGTDLELHRGSTRTPACRALAADGSLPPS